MIVEWGMDVGTALVVWLTSLISDYTVPEWFASIGSVINGFFGGLSGTGVWVNWPLVGVCASAVMASWLVFSNIKLARVGFSHVPQVGGGGN